MPAKKNSAEKVTTRISVGYSHKIGLENYSSHEANLRIEFDAPISADCELELAGRIQQAFLFVRNQVERQIAKHTETFKTAREAIRKCTDLKQLESFAERIGLRITEGKIEKWEVDELQEALNEKRINLTDYNEHFPPKEEPQTQQSLTETVT